jgi:hypothetical protein
MLVLPSLLIAAAGVACSIDTGAQRAVVVELFTSQGCSSCPPADRWLGSLRARYGDRVIPLSMHVGYWDYIGWKDPFARREFNERQRLLAGAGGSSTVYTPEVFVQGRELPDWSRPAAFDAVVSKTLQQPAAARLSLSVQLLSADAVSVAVRGEAPPGARLWLALVQSGLATAVSAGENRGATLRNDHVVRDWSGPLAVSQATTMLRFPVAQAGQPAAPGTWSVVALVDDAKGATMQAARLDLDQCSAGTPSRR